MRRGAGITGASRAIGIAVALVAVAAPAPAAAAPASKVPSAVILTVRDHWNLDYKYRDKWQLLDACDVWLPQSESSEYHIDYSVTWKHITVPFNKAAEDEHWQDLDARAQRYSFNEAFEETGDCLQQPETTSCSGYLEPDPVLGGETSLLRVRTKDQAHAPPAKRIAKVLTYDLPGIQFDSQAGFCASSTGNPQDPRSAADFLGRNPDGDLEASSLPLNDARVLRVHANSPRLVEGKAWRLDRDFYTTKLFSDETQKLDLKWAKNCSSPDDVPDGYREDECTQKLADPEHHTDVTVEDVIYGNGRRAAG